MNRRDSCLVLPLVSNVLVAGGLMTALTGCPPTPTPPSPPASSASALPVSPNVESPPFPGPTDFIGGYDAAARSVTDGGQSTYDGALLVAMLESQLVASVLPAGLELAAPLIPAARHPVVLLVGIQRNPLEVREGLTHPIPLSDDYREAMLLVPFVVRVPGNQRWHTYVVRMYLDDLRPVAIGNTVFGYAKKLAILAETGTFPSVKTTVHNLGSTLLFQSDVQKTGAWQAAAVAIGLPRWGDVRTIFEMPIVGTVPIVGFVCSYWEWSLATAEVAPATATFRFAQPFQPTMADWVARGTLSSAADGALVIRGLQWRLALRPPGCQF